MKKAEKGWSFTDKEKHFILEYAFKIHELELVTSLISNMAIENETEEDLRASMNLYLKNKKSGYRY